MKKQLYVKIISIVLVLIIISSDFAVYAFSDVYGEIPIEQSESVMREKNFGELNDEVATCSDNSLDIVETAIYSPYWEESANFSNLVIFVEFADTAEEHNYRAELIEKFNGTRDYFYNNSYKKFMLENIIPQYSEIDEEINTFTLERTAEEYIVDEKMDESAFLEDVIAEVEKSGLITREMNLHYSNADSEIVDYLTIVVPAENENSNVLFTSHNGEYSNKNELLIGDIAVHKYSILSESDLLGEDAQQVINQRIWNTFDYKNWTDNKALDCPTTDYQASVLKWYSIPVLTSNQNTYKLGDIAAVTAEISVPQAVILKTELSDTEYFIVEYREELSEDKGASDLLVYRVNTEIAFGAKDEAERIQLFRYDDEFIYSNGDKSNIFIENVILGDEKNIFFDVRFEKPEKLVAGLTKPAVDENGKVLTGWNVVEGKKYYYDQNGFFVKGWYKTEGYWYYATADGSMAKGVKEIDGKNYYFDDNCRMSTGWKKISGKYRYFDSAAYRKDCCELTYTDSGNPGGWVTLSDGRKSYISTKKGVLTGLWTISGKKYYFNSKGIMQKNAWYRVNDYWYYATADGNMAKGVKKIDGKNYYFDDNCRMSTGWKKISGKYRYFDSAAYRKDCCELTYTDSGNPGGWVTLSDGRKSYISTKRGVLTGLWTISGKKYYFNSKGIMQKDAWYRVNGYWYYATANGNMAKGVKKIDGKNYYFDDNCRMSTGWKKISGKYRYFDSAAYRKDCCELTYTDSGNPGGWVTLSDGRRCYISTKKGVLTGWQTISKKKYYFNSKGIMLSGWQTISGKKYFFNLNGIYIPMAKPTISSVTSSAYGKVTVKWNEITGVDDYVVQYSTSSKFTTGTTTAVKVNNTTTHKVTLKDLKPNKTYYFRVKYTVQGGDKKDPVTATSKYSTAKSIKTKGEVTATATSAVISTCKITSGSRDGGITVQFKATLKDRLKSGDKKYYIVQTASYGTAIDIKTPCASVDKDFTVSVKFNIKGSGVDQALMNKFALAIKKSDGTYQVVSTPKGITNPEFISENKTAILKTVSKKGIQGAGFADAADTNSKHTLFNIDLADIVSTKAKSGYVPYKYKGKTYYFSDCSGLVWELEQMAKGYDQYIQGTTGKKNEISVTMCILLSYKSETSYLIDKAARTKGYKYYMLNVREEKARETLEAVFLYLGEVFGREDCYVTNWVLGNEVNSSKAWNYSGSLSQDSYMKCYASAFRILYNGVKASKAGNNVHISLDNGWCAAPDTYSGKSTLDKFASYAHKENPSMIWGIAYHGYSYPLTRNDFWNDSSNTTNSTSTRYISMKNISVLTKYAATLESKYNMPSGSIRVILSEQGYNAGKGSYDQAYALARGYYMAEFNNRIDAFIIRALQDAQEEASGGLYLGIKNRYEEKRTSYYVYENMDSDLTKFGKKTPSKYVSSANINKFKEAQKILYKTNWTDIIPNFKKSKLSSMY